MPDFEVHALPDATTEERFEEKLCRRVIATEKKNDTWYCSQSYPAKNREFRC